MNNRRIAVKTGWILISMAIIAGFSIGYAFSEFYQIESLDSLKRNIQSKFSLYQAMLVGMWLIFLLDLWVSYTVFVYFKNDNRTISLLSASLRIIYTMVFGIAILYLTLNLNIHHISKQTIETNFLMFKSIWSLGLVIFGFHVVLLGVLMKRHIKIPKFLWIMAMLAGVSYAVVHGLKLSIPNTNWVNNLENILALPMAIGELGLAIWLISKGGKSK